MFIVNGTVSNAKLPMSWFSMKKMSAAWLRMCNVSGVGLVGANICPN